MTTETDVQERIDRAAEREVEFTVASSDPLVVQAHSEHSDRIHTLVPNALHCSCEDDTYRGPVCYHLIALALLNDWRGEVVRATIEDEYQRVTDELAQIEGRVEDLRTQETALSVLRREVAGDERPEAEREQEAAEVAEQLSEIAEDAGATTESDDFQEMVEDLSSERTSASEEGGSSRAERGEDLSQ